MLSALRPIWCLPLPRKTTGREWRRVLDRGLWLQLQVLLQPHPATPGCVPQHGNGLETSERVEGFQGQQTQGGGMPFMTNKLT